MALRQDFWRPDRHPRTWAAWGTVLGALGLMVATAWFALARVQDNIRRDVARGLSAVLDTTHNAFHDWAKHRRSDTALWATDPDVVGMAEVLLEVPRTSEALLAHPTQAQLREFLSPIMEAQRFESFRVIAPDGVVTAATEASVVGHRSRHGREGDFLERVLAGEPVLMLPRFVLPPYAEGDVHLEHGTIHEMTVAAPIQTVSGPIIGVLEFHVDATRDFRQISISARLGETGETYVFDGTGHLLTESRFETELRNAGLLKPGQSSEFALALRDPGGNLLRGHRPMAPRSDLPLTRAVAAAVTGAPGVDVDGYRDYRGVPVVGAWMWDAEFGVGLVTKQDVVEAYRSMRAISRLVGLAVGTIVLLSGGLLVVQTVGSRRARLLAQRVGESETRYRTLATMAPVGIFRTDAAGQCNYVNTRWCEITGCAPEEALGVGWSQRLHPEDRDRVSAAWRDAAEAGHPFRDEYRFRTVNGATKWVLGQATPQSDADGNITGYVGTITDITARYQAEQDLRRSEENYLGILNQATFGVVIHDGSRIQFVNAAVERMSGWSAADLVGRGYENVLTPEARNFVTAVRDMRDRGMEAPDTYELDAIDAKGHPLVIEISRTPIRYHGAEAIMVTLVDVTERKQAEADLARHTAFERMVAEISTDLMARGLGGDIRAGIETALERVGRFVGADRAQFSSVLPGRDEALAYAWTSPGAMCQLAGTLGQWTVERYKRGEVVNVPSVAALPAGAAAERAQWEACCVNAMLGVPLFADNDYAGQISFLMCSAEREWSEDDITLLRMVGEVFVGALRRHDTEDALRQSEVRHRAVVESAADAILTMDAAGRVVSWNSAGEAAFGWTAEEVIGRELGELIVGEGSRATQWEALRRCLETGEEHNVGRPLELTALRKDGTVFPCEVVVTTLELGDAIQFLGVIRDTSERTNLEQQLRQAQKLEALGTLASGIAHDFNNILSPILGYAELARERLMPHDPLVQDLDEVITASWRASDLVQQILAFGRQVESEPVPLKVAVLVKEGLKLLRAGLPTSITIESKMDASGATVVADPIHIHQIVMNLCTNAGHAMPDGGVLRVGLREVDVTGGNGDASRDLAPGPYVCLTVEDTGCGIPPELQDRIFDPYFTTKGVDEGTGLGLAVVHGIVASMGGRITVASTPGEGSRFSVYFPASASGQQAKDDESTVVTYGRGERVLLVDDDSDVLDLEAHLLSRLGYHVTTCASAVEALERIGADPELFDVLVTDHTMPRMSGMQLARAVRCIRSDLPIVLCTGFAHGVTRDTAKAVGIDELHMKPISPDAFGQIVRLVLDRRAGKRVGQSVHSP